MQYAERMSVPFWPAASVVDIPYLIFDWYAVAAIANERARPTLERRAKQRAAHEAAMSGADH